jgi:sialate O-acetylesterase
MTAYLLKMSTCGVALWFLCGYSIFAQNPLVDSASSTPTTALPFLHPIFNSHMVLQRDQEDSVWGWTTPGTSISVEVKGDQSMMLQTKTASAGQDGRWQVLVGPFKPTRDNSSISMIVSSPNQPTVTLNDILIGDVWLCSGQSNMARSLAWHNGIPDIPNQDQEIKDTINFPQIRQYYVANAAASQPQLLPCAVSTDETGVSGPWVVNNPESAARPSRYSAVAYFYGRTLNQKLGIPIGIIQMSWGGTSIQSWIDPVTLAEDPEFTQAVSKLPAKASSKTVSAIYNGKVAAITSFKIKGVVWYQGENNENAPQQYEALLPLLFKSWRKGFESPALPFIVIQLPNFAHDTWPVIREAQRDAVSKDTNSRLVVTIDLGDPKQLHPGDKQDVGYRTALAALNLAYGQDLVYSGPILSKAIAMGNKIICSFDSVGAGLMVGQREIPPTKPFMPTLEVPNGKLAGFELAGDDGNFYPAQAIITGKGNVEISSSSVATPQSIRYAWAGAPTCNLYNNIVDGTGKVVDGLPASPFLFTKGN